MSKRKPARLSRNTPKRKAAPASAPVEPSSDRTPVDRRDIAMIDSALGRLPALDPSKLHEDRYPFLLDIAEPDHIFEATIEKLVRRALDDRENVWAPIHKPMLEADGPYNGYRAWMDEWRYAAFLVGVRYVVRALPAWWDTYRAGDDDFCRGIDRIVQAWSFRREQGKGGE